MLRLHLMQLLPVDEVLMLNIEDKGQKGILLKNRYPAGYLFSITFDFQKQIPKLEL